MNLEHMNKQLTQVFEYAEMLVRLNSVQELLDLNGYFGEAELNQLIEEMKIKIRQNMEVHLSNSGVSKTAMVVVSNADYLRLHKFC